MLLNLASLCHPKRHELWIANPPAAIYGLDELVCWPEGHPITRRQIHEPTSILLGDLETRSHAPVLVALDPSTRRQQVVLR